MRAIAFVVALAVGCGADEASRPGAAAPASERSAAPRAELAPPPGDGLDASATSSDEGDAATAPALVPAQAGAPPREPSFGAIESISPADAHTFRLAVALRAARANRSGAKVMKMLSLLPDVIDARARTGVDPFADGEWLLVYGSKVAVPGPNANVVKHARAEAEVAKAMADGGFQARDAGTTSVHSEIYGVRDVLLRPQPGMLALVPGDRASDLATVLAKPLDLGVKPGELARAFFAEPAELLRFLPAEVRRANVNVKAASDGGLDASAEADCPDAEQCKATATAIEELVKTQNSLMVRFVTKNLLGGLVLRADGAKLKATLHAAPDQVDVALNLVRSELGLPGEAPGEPTHR